MYKLEAQTYHLQIGEPYWMPEVGLGIGRGRQVIGGVEQEALLWSDAQGQAYPTPDDVIQGIQMALEAERQRAEAERQRAAAERQRSGSGRNGWRGVRKVARC